MDRLATVTLDPGAAPHLNRSGSISYDARGQVHTLTDALAQTTETHAYFTNGAERSFADARQ